MKTSMLLTTVLVGLLGGLAWAATGPPGTSDTGDVNLRIDPYCSVVVDDAVITVSDPLTGAANAYAACTASANFAAIITPAIVAEEGYENTDNDWMWSGTIASGASKTIEADEESTDAVNVAVSGVDLTDAVIGSFTKVATLTVTITTR
jgi:hypothetical protein